MKACGLIHADVVRNLLMEVEKQFDPYGDGIKGTAQIFHT